MKDMSFVQQSEHLDPLGTCLHLVESRSDSQHHSSISRLRLDRDNDGKIARKFEKVNVLPTNRPTDRQADRPTDGPTLWGIDNGEVFHFRVDADCTV